MSLTAPKPTLSGEQPDAVHTELLAKARDALRKVYEVPGLTDEQRLGHAKKLGAALRKLEFKTGQTQLTSWPAVVELPVAGKCNYRCTMCSLSHGAPTWPNWTLEEVARFRPFFRFASAVNPTGVGEPLTNKDFFPILELFREYGLVVGFYTNASVLTPDKADKLIDSGVQHVNVSLDGATAETFNRIRRHGSFDTVIANVRHLIKRRNERGAQYPMVHVAMVLMRSNMHELPEMIRLAADLGAVSVYTNFVSGTVPDEQCEHEPARTNFMLRSAKQVASELGISFMCPAELPEDPSPLVGDAQSPAESKPSACICTLPWTQFLVHNDGSAAPCCQIRGEVDGRRFGNINESAPETLWNSEGMVYLRGKLLTGDLPEVCRKCTLRRLSLA